MWGRLKTCIMILSVIRSCVCSFSKLQNFQQRISWFSHRWRTQRNAIRNVNCRFSWIIESLNAHCALWYSRGHACLSVISLSNPRVWWWAILSFLRVCLKWIGMSFWYELQLFIQCIRFYPSLIDNCKLLSKIGSALQTLIIKFDLKSGRITRWT